MAALDMSLVARSEFAVHQLMKRKNWAQREPGVIVVFVIVFLVAILVIAMFINKKVRSCLIAHNPQPQVTNIPYRRTQSRLAHKIPPQNEVESDVIKRDMWR
jgi:hypothetical protein